MKVVYTTFATAKGSTLMAVPAFRNEMSALHQLLRLSAAIDGPVLDSATIPDSLKVVTPGASGLSVFDAALLVAPPGVVLELVRKKLFEPFRIAATTHVFAFDLFAGMYGIEADGSVVSIDAETGERQDFARDLEAWAALILEKPGSLLGAELGRAWQQLHGPLAPLERLVPRQPFVLGGNYEVSNLVRCPLPRAVELYGSLCEQIAATPDGSRVEVRGWWPVDEP